MLDWLKFQHWVSDRLRKAGLKARVCCQSHGGLGSPDVDAHPFSIECKLYKKVTYRLICDALRQSRKDTAKSDKYPIAITEDADGRTLVHMEWKDFENLVIEFIAKKEEGDEPS